MLDQHDIDRVSSYIYEGFPQLKERFTAHSFDSLRTENLDNTGMLAFWVGENSLYTPPRDMARVSNMFMLARQFVQAAQHGQTHETESLSDAVAAACVLSLEGREAKWSLGFIRDNRLATDDPLHDSGILLLHLLGDKSYPGTMNAKEALDHAKRLFDRYYPAKTEPAEPSNSPRPAARMPAP